MKEKKQKVRVIVRPWLPRKIPYTISFEKVNEVIMEAKPKVGSILYVGWSRRVMEGKKVLLYLVATGNSSSEARKVFKTGENFGENIWIIS